MKSCVVIVMFLTAVAIAGPVARVVAEGSADLAVEFLDCVESIGVGLVSTDRARALVPADFVLAGEGGPVTPLVVRTARCGAIAVADHQPRPGAIVQIGLVIVPPDFTGDVNLSTLWYYTSDAKVAHYLTRVGIRAQLVPTIDYSYEAGADGSLGALFVAVPRPGRPALWLDGSVAASPTPSGAFIANWWARAGDGSVKMSTSVPEIFIGEANLTVVTAANGALGHLIEGGSAGFPVLQQFNHFAGAHMTVSVN